MVRRARVRLNANNVTDGDQQKMSVPGILPAPWPRRLRITAAVVVLLALVGACHSTGSPKANQSAAPTVSAPVPDARDAAEQAALAAYRGMWQAYAKAGLTANPDEPDLAKYATDRALKTLRGGLTDLRGKGHVIRGEYTSKPQVVEATPALDPNAISVRDCLDTRRFLTYKGSGDLVDDEPGGFRLTRATVTNLGADGWKVTSFGVQAVGTCG